MVAKDRKLGKYEVGAHAIGKNAETKQNEVAVKKNQMTPIHLTFKRIKSIRNNIGGTCLSLKNAEKQNGADPECVSGSRSRWHWLLLLLEGGGREGGRETCFSVLFCHLHWFMFASLSLHIKSLL